MIRKKDFDSLLKRVEALELDNERDMLVTHIPDFSYGYYSGMPTKEKTVLTTSGKINAIVKHLGINIDVIEEKIVPASVKVTKGKK